MNPQTQPRPDTPTPETEGIKYAGSKLKMLPHIVDMVAGLDIRSALDAFSGTTRVAQAFAQMGYDTTANDVAVWSEVFATCYLLARKPDDFYAPLIAELNALPGRRGWFAEHYGGEDGEGKRPFSMTNAMRLDAIRERIEDLGPERADKCVLLTSLILALDAVDNTLGHYAAYLAGWSARSRHELCLRLPRRCAGGGQHRVVRGDAFDIVGEYHDLVYLDPPYGSKNDKMPPSRVRYAAYYHLWKTVILNDRPPLFGKANRREDSRDSAAPSVFEEYRRDADGHSTAMKALEALIARTNAHYILLSYSSGGRVSHEELHEILRSNGKLREVRAVNYKKNVMSSMRRTNEWVCSDGSHHEYLFLLEKQSGNIP